MANQRNRASNNPLGFLPAVIMLILGFIALYYVATGIFYILSLLAPVFLIATLVIDHTVVTGYAKWIWNLIQKNWIAGVGAGLMTFFGFPVVSGFLLGKAVLKKKVANVREDFESRTQGDYVEYEEVPDVKETPVEDLEFEEIEEMELEDLDDIVPPKVKQKQTRSNDNDYDQMFE